MENSPFKISEDQKQYRVVLSKITFIGLLIAVLPIWPYVFYQLLKLIVCGTAVFSAYLYNKEMNKKWMWTMIMIAFIFNPINVLYFGAFFWSLIDIIVAVCFFRAPKK